MTSKVRLTLDSGIQLFLISILLIELIVAPEHFIQHISSFAFSISIWQILHAIYVVQKYRDWHRSIYLKQIKSLVLLSIFILMGAGSIFLVSLGNWWPYILPILQGLGIVLGFVLAGLAFHYFWHSIKAFYIHWTQPRSFWDL